MCAIPTSVVHTNTRHQDVKTNAAAAAENAAAVQSLEDSPTHYETVVNVTVTEGACVTIPPNRHYANARSHDRGTWTPYCNGISGTPSVGISSR